MNENEWQRPYEFMPRRFDTSCHLSETPSGKRRNPASYAPYVGGKRICLGKTLAEAQLKITLTYLTQNFNFEFVNKTHQLILTHPCTPRNKTMHVILTKNQVFNDDFNNFLSIFYMFVLLGKVIAIIG